MEMRGTIIVKNESREKPFDMEKATYGEEKIVTRLTVILHQADGSHKIGQQGSASLCVDGTNAFSQFHVGQTVRLQIETEAEALAKAGGDKQQI